MQGDHPRVVRVDAVDPEPELIASAAEVIRGGGLVAFPTETVYGLGANALDPAAVETIFEAKKRPANNPLIVHIAQVEDARALVEAWPEAAQKLAEALWPGPLSMVLPRTDTVPKIVTAGLGTVGIRLPAHPVARALIESAGCPIAAPSANLYTGVSPTSAKHVSRALGADVDMILDAGTTRVGIESTVIRIEEGQVTILRPGMITADDLARVVDEVSYADTTQVAAQERPSPGMAPKHYSPSCTVELVDDVDAALDARSGEARVGWMFLVEPPVAPSGPWHVVGQTPERYAERLYAVMHDLDEKGVGRIVVERPPSSDPWRGISDRLSRAAVD